MFLNYSSLRIFLRLRISRTLNFISLIELELDFSEEDVEFANRDELRLILKEISTVINELINSFKD